MKDIIEKKNKLLREAYEKLSKIRKITVAMEDTLFNSPEAADVYMEIVSKTINELTWGRFRLLEESNIGLPDDVNADAIEDLPLILPEEDK